MSNLWNPSLLSPPAQGLAGETIPALFWNAVHERGPQVWMRQKDLGIWRSWTWTQTAQAVREMNQRLGLPSGLAALGVREDDFDRIIDGALVDHCHKLNPREASRDDYRELLRQSM